MAQFQAAAWPFLFAFLVSLALVPAGRRVALRYGFVAAPRQDRWHQRPVALFGGVAIVLTVAIGLLLFGVTRQIGVLVACSALMFATGLADDIRPLRSSTKLLIEIVIASLLLAFGFRLNWTISLTLDTLLTLVWVVGMTNAFNLLDNMDGLCAGIALIVGAGLLLQLPHPAAGSEAVIQIRYLALLMGATAGFLVYNVYPASIFMGDSGSLVLGLSFAALTLSRAVNYAAPANRANEVAVLANPLSTVAVPLLVLLIPIFDTTLVTASRLISGRSPATGGRDHSSHRLVAIGLSERAAVVVLWGLAAVGGALGVAVDRFNLSWSGLMASLFVLAMIMFAVFLSRVRVYDDADATVDRNAITPLVVDFMYKRRVLEVLLDVCLVVIAYYSSYRLRFEGAEFTRNFVHFYRSLPLMVVAQMVALFTVGTYRGVWRYFGLMDTVGIAKGIALGTAVGMPLVLLVFRSAPYSRTVFVIDAMLLAILLTASRVSFRLIAELVHRSRSGVTRVVVYGAGDGGALVVREFANSPRSPQIIGFVDDDPRKQRLRVQGYPVLGGYESLVSLIGSGVVDAVVVSTRAIDPDRQRDLKRICGEHRVTLSQLHVDLEVLIDAGDDVAYTDRDVSVRTPAS